MEAQVTVQFKKALNVGAFLTGLPEQDDKMAVLRDTNFIKTPEIIENILYAHEGPTEKLILFEDGVSTLIAHLMPKTVAPSLGRIKDKANLLVSKFFDAARNSEQKIKSLEVGIVFEDEVILKGPYHSKRARVWKLIRDGIIRDTIICALSFCILLYFGVKTTQAFVPIVAAALGLPIWGIVLGLLEKEQIDYEER